MIHNRRHRNAHLRLARLLAGSLLLATLATACRPADTPAPAPTATTALQTQAPPPVTSTPTQPAPTEVATPTPLPSPTYTSEPKFTATPTALPEAIVDEFGVPMVLVPAGPFVMGSDHDYIPARPAHTVYLDSYYMDQFEVTNERYLACAEAGVCTTGGSTRIRNPVFVGHPAMDVTWYEAERYCEWRGARLPTEAEWEKAARGTDERRFPWGNDPITCELARYGDCGMMSVPVGQHPAGVSPYGIHDMAGNAWEWTADWYEREYYSHSPAENPAGPQEDTGWKVTRGGAWYYMGGLMTTIWRNHAPPYVAYSYLGFRCAKSP